MVLVGRSWTFFDGYCSSSFPIYEDKSDIELDLLILLTCILDAVYVHMNACHTTLVDFEMYFIRGYRDMSLCTLSFRTTQVGTCMIFKAGTCNLFAVDAQYHMFFVGPLSHFCQFVNLYGNGQKEPCITSRD